jgi:hypothetical protein
VGSNESDENAGAGGEELQDPMSGYASADALGAEEDE